MWSHEFYSAECSTVTQMLASSVARLTSTKVESRKSRYIGIIVAGPLQGLRFFTKEFHMKLDFPCVFLLLLGSCAPQPAAASMFS